MTIIKSGKERYRQECDRCGCIFSYGKMDVENVCIQDCPEEIWQDTVACPECFYLQKADFVWNTAYLDEC